MKSSPVPETDIRRCTDADLPEVRTLFRQYAGSLGFDLCFQNFDQELASLPRPYAPPGGALFVAGPRGSALGCVGLRPLEHGCCELKRLYVRPEARGTHLGRRLTETAIAEARRLAYSRMRLDTVPGMERAQALYADLGFQEIEAYRANPVPGTRYLELVLPS